MKTTERNEQQTTTDQDGRNRALAKKNVKKSTRFSGSGDQYIHRYLHKNIREILTD